MRRSNQNTPQKIRKVYGLKIESVDGNSIKGSASGIGNLDRGLDVVFPQFYSVALAGFRQAGFVALGHDWAALPIAMPTAAEEKGTQLYTEATFHSTQAAQDARTVAVERKGAGLDVGLSVGFSIASDGAKIFANGDALLTWAKEQKYDMSLFDEEGISACKTTCRGLVKCAELYEYSLVTVPMNPEATVSEAKSLKFYSPSGYSYDYSTGTYSYLENTAADCTIATLNTLYYDLCDDVAATLGDSSLTPTEMGDSIEEEFSTFATQAGAVTRSLMTILASADDATKSAAIEAIRKGVALRTGSDTPQDKPMAEPGSAPSQDEAVKSAQLRYLENMARANGVAL